MLSCIEFGDSKYKFIDFIMKYRRYTLQDTLVYKIIHIHPMPTIKAFMSKHTLSGSLKQEMRLHTTFTIQLN